MNDPGGGYIGAMIRGEQEQGGPAVQAIRRRLGLPAEPPVQAARARKVDPARKAKRKAAKAARKRNRP